ncbi:MAG: NAD(P)H:quinone oxidoreductase [Saccharolobus sp.]|uniref:Tryptophan repressor binding protein n=2 Tax=Saccharolobus shibatae TaxID=2286 RepID=A0A8F5GY70_9CREN|nr:NAD(P)H:quinone oxidoreductase [Saccharolobus shibatae]MCH4815513.1 NAD(P)H:quinone oxidoreductase [Saccharolobus shibatae]QXJ27472.1 Tryptophan repressor binding protein [Saccharolobus shibatae B12]QXJ30783.1 Tryptophan repressor binding protein [Saccharolobus shibatae]QXJ33810.1 Tryptophan repressor binding protein [Saccharolobus shibatae]
MECPKILVLFYGYGSIVDLAKNVAEGAKEITKEVKLARVKEYLPEEMVKKFRIPIDTVKDIPEATLSDLEWADGIVMGSPTRYGNMTGQLKLFLDQTAELWIKGALYGKPVGFFTEASTIHGGHESTILAMANYAYHHGMIIVPVGYGIREVSSTMTGGSPYGASHLGNKKELDENEIAIAKFLGKRVAEVAKKLRC